MVLDQNKVTKWYSSEEFEKKYTYSENNLGAAWSVEKTVFRVWAPTADQVSVNLYDSGESVSGERKERQSMKPYKNGVWILEKKGNLHGKFYTYSVVVDGQENEACDPYAKAVGINGDRAMVVDLHSTDPEGWEMDTRPFHGRKVTEMIIYEAHIRDLTVSEDSGIINKGKFLGLAEDGTKNSSGESTGLDYIADLGVTHIHLLPVFDFASVDEKKEGQYNWGYDPKNFFVPEGSYATDPFQGQVRILEIKKMIQAFHKKGIGVILDVVFNHVYDAGTFCFHQIVPGYFSRIDETGVYSNGSFCGNDTASERSMVRNYIVQNVLYWLEEYHVDGFRFDLVGLLDIETVNEIVERVRAVYPEALLYGEGWSMPTHMTKKKELAVQLNSDLTPGFAYFNDTIRNLLRGRNSELLERGYVNGARGRYDCLKSNLMGNPFWADSPAQVVNYVSCHDDLTLYDRLNAADPDSEKGSFIRAYKLAAAIVFASAGIPFFQAGEELLRRKVNKDGTLNSNSYCSGDEVNAISWNCLTDADCRDMHEYYKGLVAFRKEHPALRMGDRKMIKRTRTFADISSGEEVICYIDCRGVEGEKGQMLCMAFNPEKEKKTLSLQEGSWDIYVTGEKAGTQVLGTVTDRVEILPVSCMFLVKTDCSAEC